MTGMARSSKAVFLGFIFAVSLLGQFTLVALGDSFDTGMNVKDEPPNDLWWLRGQARAEDNPPAMMAVTDRLSSLIFDEKRADLRAVYGNCYVNPGNSTVFVVLTNCDVETIAMFNAALDPPVSVRVIYRTGPASYETLEGYADAIGGAIFDLPRGVVEVNAMGITENATLLIGISEVTPAAVEALANAIRGLAPEELIVVRRMGVTRATTGGIAVQALPIITAIPSGSTPVDPRYMENPGPARTSADTADLMLTPVDFLTTSLSVLIPLLLLTLARRSLSL